MRWHVGTKQQRRSITMLLHCASMWMCVRARTMSCSKVSTSPGRASTLLSRTRSFI